MKRTSIGLAAVAALLVMTVRLLRSAAGGPGEA